MKVDLTEVEAHRRRAARGGRRGGGLGRRHHRVRPDPTARLSEETLDKLLAERLAGYKRPRALHLLDQLPRTTTGKLVRSTDALRSAVTP